MSELTPRRFRITPATEHDGEGSYGVVCFDADEDGEWVAWDEMRRAVAAERSEIRKRLCSLLIRENVDGYDVVRRKEVLDAFDAATSLRQVAPTPGEPTVNPASKVSEPDEQASSGESR